MYVEDICLNNRFELTADQRTGVLHDVVGSDRMYGQPVDVGGLKAKGISLFLFIGPRFMRDVPNILDHSKQDSMEDFNWRIPCWIET